MSWCIKTPLSPLPWAWLTVVKLILWLRALRNSLAFSLVLWLPLFWMLQKVLRHTFFYGVTTRLSLSLLDLYLFSCTLCWRKNFLLPQTLWVDLQWALLSHREILMKLRMENRTKRRQKEGKKEMWVLRGEGVVLFFTPDPLAVVRFINSFGFIVKIKLVQSIGKSQQD